MCIRDRYYEEDVRQACLALSTYPGGLQIGGGMTAENAAFFLKQGASHILSLIHIFFTRRKRNLK